MTEAQPPQEQPDFQPPGWQPPQAPPPVPSPQGQQPQQPFPVQPPVPGQAWTMPPAPPKRGRGSIWLGIGITFAVLLGAWGLTTVVRYDNPLYNTMNTVAALLPFGAFIAGIVLAAIPRTTRTGAGMLIGFGAAILIAAGLCFALIIGLGGLR